MGLYFFFFLKKTTLAHTVDKETDFVISLKLELKNCISTYTVWGKVNFFLKKRSLFTSMTPILDFCWEGKRVHAYYKYTYLWSPATVTDKENMEIGE